MGRGLDYVGLIGHSKAFGFYSEGKMDCLWLTPYLFVTGKLPGATLYVSMSGKLCGCSGNTGLKK